MFTTLMVLMPTQFITQTWNPTYEEKEAGNYYSVNNVTQYASTYSFNLTFPSYNATDFGLPSGQQLQFWWGVTLGVGKSFQVRHLTDQFFGWWWGWHNLEFDNGEIALSRSDLAERMDTDTNTSLFWVDCDHVRTSIFIIPYQASWNITESWDNDELRFVTSYEVDWNASSVNAWTVLGQLLSFQSPNLGIVGIGGVILDTILALPFYILTGIAVIMLVQSMLPFIRGLVG